MPRLGAVRRRGRCQDQWRAPLPLSKEDGHPDPADATWTVVASGAKAGDPVEQLQEGLRLNGP